MRGLASTEVQGIVLHHFQVRASPQTEVPKGPQLGPHARYHCRIRVFSDVVGRDLEQRRHRCGLGIDVSQPMLFQALVYVGKSK
eukprot:3895108-Rhodomonas_salina.1